MRHGAGQNQQGAVAVLHGLPLLLIEALEKIHESGALRECGSPRF